MAQPKNETSPLLSKPEVKESSSSTSWCQKVSLFLRNISVEPVMFLHALSYSIESIFNDNMIIDKTCSLQLNYSKEVCDNLDSGNYVPEQNAVQRQTNDYKMYNNWVEYIPAIVTMIILGAWSDVRGRKLPILLPNIGSTLKALALLANAYFWYLKPAYIIIAYIPYGLCGSAMSLYMATMSYLAESSSRRGVTSRISVVGVMTMAASPGGKYLGTILYRKGGYVLVFGTEFIISSLAIIYVLLRFKSTPSSSNQQDDRAKLPDGNKFNLSKIKESVAAVVKPRDGKQRAYIIGNVVCIWITLMSMESMTDLYLYTRKRFDWNYYKYTILSMVSTGCSVVASCIITPVLSYHFKLQDSLLGFIGSCSHIYFGVMAGTAPYDWILFIAMAVSALAVMTISSSRGAISKLVPSSELGGIFSIVALGEALAPIIFQPMYTFIYNISLDTFPGAVFITGSSIGIISCCIYAWIQATDVRTEKKLPLP